MTRCRQLDPTHGKAAALLQRSAHRQVSDAWVQLPIAPGRQAVQGKSTNTVDGTVPRTSISLAGSRPIDTEPGMRITSDVPRQTSAAMPVADAQTSASNRQLAFGAGVRQPCGSVGAPACWLSPRPDAARQAWGTSDRHGCGQERSKGSSLPASTARSRVSNVQQGRMNDRVATVPAGTVICPDHTYPLKRRSAARKRPARPRAK